MKKSYLKLAVLPFSNISSNDENEYICDGITQEIITSLSQIQRLNVISRASSFHYKNTDLTLKQIGNELSIDLIIEGSVRIFKNKLKVDASLVKIINDYTIWSKSWQDELDDIFDIQDTISLDIAEAVREDFGHFEIEEHLVKSQTDNIEAYKLYLKGKYHYYKWNVVDTKMAIKFFEKAIALDANYAQSYSDLAQCYTFLAGSGSINSEKFLLKAHKLSEKAISINENIPEVYFGMANVTFWKEWDFKSTFKYLNKALALNPSFAPVYSVLSVTYVLGGQIEKAYENIEIARRLDPFSNNAKFFNALILYFDKKYEVAINMAKDILSYDQRMLSVYDLYASCLIKLGKFKETIELLNSKNGSQVEKSTKHGYLSIVYHFLNNKDKRDYHLEKLNNVSETGEEQRNGMYLFFYYCMINDKTKAIALLRKSVSMKSSFMLFGFSDPFTENIQNEPEFIELKRKMIPVDDFLSFQKSKSNRVKPLVDDLIAENWKSRIIKHIEDNKSFLNPDITLRDLAQELNLHPNQLSYILNSFINMSFTNFINSYRIQNFLDLLKQGQNSNETFIGLAYDSGFNSKTAFYNYFKKHTGKTPKQFLSK